MMLDVNQILFISSRRVDEKKIRHIYIEFEKFRQKFNAAKFIASNLLLSEHPQFWPQVTFSGPKFHVVSENVCSEKVRALLYGQNLIFMMNKTLFKFLT